MKHTKKQVESGQKFIQAVGSKLIPFKWDTVVEASQILKRSGLSLESFCDFLKMNMLDFPIGSLAEMDWRLTVWGYIAASAEVAECAHILPKISEATPEELGSLRRALNEVSTLKRKTAWKFIDDLLSENKGSVIITFGKK